MTILDRIKEASKSKDLSLQNVADLAGIGKNSIYKWNKQKPSTENLAKVADVLQVSTDYLLGKSENNTLYGLSDKDNRDIGKEVDRMLSGLSSDAEVNYYGEPMTDEDKEKMRVAMIAALQAAQIEARKKFTPKKYRNKD